MTLTFVTPVVEFLGYVTYVQPVTLIAYNAALQQLAIDQSLFSSNLAVTGDVGSSPNELFYVRSARGIQSITLTGGTVGDSFTLDDITFTPVPEPGTVVLMLTGVGALILRRRHTSRRRTRHRGEPRQSVALLQRALGLACVLSVAHLAGVDAAPTIGAVAVTPNVIPANTPSTVTMTAEITDATVIPSSVILQELNSTETGSTKAQWRQPPCGRYSISGIRAAL